MMLQTQSRGDVRLLLLLVTMFVSATIFLSPSQHGVANASDGSSSSNLNIIRGATGSWFSTSFRDDDTISDTLYKQLCSSSFRQRVDKRLQEHIATIGGQVSSFHSGLRWGDNERPHQENFYK